MQSDQGRERGFDLNPDARSRVFGLDLSLDGRSHVSDLEFDTKVGIVP